MLWGWNRKLSGPQSVHLCNREQEVPSGRELEVSGVLAHHCPATQHIGLHLQTLDLSLLWVWDWMAWFGSANAVTTRGFPTPGCYPLSNLFKWWMISLVKMEFDSESHRERRASMPANTLFICGFGLLKTNDARAVLWAPNELFIHPIKLFYWRTQTCLTLEFSLWCVGILLSTF